MASSTLKVLYTPQYIGVDEFARIFAPLEGYQTCRLVKGPDGEQIGFVEFTSPLAAEKARGIYNDWQGWGPKGLQIDLALGGAEQPGAGVKRGREDMMADGGAYKQQRTDQASNMGYGAQTVKQELQNGAYSVQAAPLANGGYDPSNAAPSAGAYGQQQVNMGAAANGPQYTVVGQSPNVQQATTDPRFGVPPRISPTHQAPASYTQEAYNASGTQAPSATQYPSQAAPVAAQPAQYGAPQVQYPSQPSSMQPSQYPGSNTAQAGQYTPQQLAPGQTSQQPLQPQAGYSQPSAQVPTYSAQPQATQYVQQAPTQSQYPSTVQQPAYQQGAQQAPPQQQQANPQQQAYMGMPSQVPPQQAPQQPAPAPGVQYPTPVPSQYPHQQQPAQQPAQQQPPPMQMAPPAQPGGLGPGQMIPQPAPMVQPTQMQYAPPVQPAPVAQFVRPDQQPYRDGPPPRYEERPPEGRQRGPPAEELPPDAASTIYVDGLPMDVNKRELAHIFRPFHGYLDLRIIHKRDKNEREIVIAFAEFADVYASTACMRLLQNYPWDLDAENSPVLRLSYARPPKALQDRNRGGPDARGGQRGSYNESHQSGGGRRQNYRDDDRGERSRHSGFSDNGGRGGSSRPPPRSAGSDRGPSRGNGRGRP